MTLQAGSKGKDVERWQVFLRGRGSAVTVTGVFDEATAKATKAYQKYNGEIADGIVGNATLAQALADGFDAMPLANIPENPKDNSQAWPLCVGVSPLSDQQRNKLFGAFDFTPAPTKGNPEAIVVDTAWVKQNIVTVTVGANGPSPRKLRLHRVVAPRFEALYAAWQEAGLLDRILTWDGSYNARYIRGSVTKLSNHAYGSAFDINAAQNGLGVVPPLVGQWGSVRELVPLANKHGFYWGGHYQNRKDGMHFEFVGVPK